MAFVAQQLYGADSSVRLSEAVQARVKDPLWFLARQWQVGEFAAENGGRPAAVTATWSEYPLATVVRSDGGPAEPLDLDAPLEWAIERENQDGDSPAWRAEALEHEVALATAAHGLRAPAYAGGRIDWHAVDLVDHDPAVPPGDTGTRTLVPTQLTVPGAPHPRWWRIEDPDAYLDSPHDPEPNVLSVLLPELTYVDVNDWFLVPLPQRAGTVRAITALTVTDSFGIVTDVPALGADGWQVFALTPDGVDPAVANGLLFLPHCAVDVLGNDELEDVHFVRDELANVAWAVERAYLDAEGHPVRDGDPDPTAPPPPAPAPPGDEPRFRFAAPAPRTWIPYLPRIVRGAEGARLYLRRGRTDPDASTAAPQYRTKIVDESRRVGEYRVPAEGVRVRRGHRFARGSDGNPFFWVGRRTEPAPRATLPRTAYDYLE
ncbi:hypothetical protein [Pseudonocardia sp.]|uniref:hypothetical protein n=1 Tax=Pseudonocardia sp. TaxID=60912 RepID=UPI003D11AB4F